MVATVPTDASEASEASDVYIRILAPESKCRRAVRRSRNTGTSFVPERLPFRKLAQLFLRLRLHSARKDRGLIGRVDLGRV